MSTRETTRVDGKWGPPKAGDYEMCDEDGRPTIWPASDNYNADRARMAHCVECDYIDVQMETCWMVWAPEDAEAQWREDRCDCEEPHYRDDGFVGCESTKPATELYDFWDEDGWYCPWTCVKRSTPGAIKFRRGSERIRPRQPVPSP